MKPLITSEDFPIGACVLVEREGKRIWLKTGVRKPCIVSDPHGLWQYNAWSYEVTEEPPKRHEYWYAGQPDCPPELKAGGELHTLKCKVCGQENPRSSVCSGMPNAKIRDGEDGDSHSL